MSHVSLSFSDFGKAYRKVRKGKKISSHRKFRNFKSNSSNSLGLFFSDKGPAYKLKVINSLYNDFTDGLYLLQPYTAVVLPKKNGIRTILVPKPRDRILFTAINSKLLEIFSPEIQNYYVFGSGKRNKLKNARAIIQEVYECSQKHKYVLKIDIKKFFPSINKNILLETLKDHVDTKIFSIIMKSFNNQINFILDSSLSNSLKDEAKSIAQNGIPQGCAYSPLLANLYALPLDKKVKESGYTSFRYLDDMIIFLDSRESAGLLFDELQKVGEKLDLKMHPIGYDRAKTYIQETTEPFEYLGIDIMPDGTYKIPESKIQKEVGLITKSILTLETIKQFGLKKVIEVLQAHIKGWRTYYQKNFNSAYQDKVMARYNDELDTHYKTRPKLKKELKKMGIDIYKKEQLYKKFFFL